MAIYYLLIVVSYGVFLTRFTNTFLSAFSPPSTGEIQLSDIIDKGLKKAGLNIPKPVLAALCILFGILLFIIPELVSYLLGAFLLYTAIVLLIEHYDNSGRKKPKQPRSSPTKPT